MAEEEVVSVPMAQLLCVQIFLHQFLMEIGLPLHVLMEEDLLHALMEVFQQESVVGEGEGDQDARGQRRFVATVLRQFLTETFPLLPVLTEPDRGVHWQNVPTILKLKSYLSDLKQGIEQI